MPKISVIVPVYNKAKYLDDCLKSLTSENLEDIEIMVIDDASTDNSLDIIQQYKSKYPEKIRVYTNSFNKGVGACRNMGIVFSQGFYITFVDADDFIHPDMYKDMYKGAEETGFPEIVSTKICFINEDEKLNNASLKGQRHKGTSYYLPATEDVIVYESPSCCDKLFRMDIARDINFLEDKRWEDFGYSYGALFSSKRLLKFNHYDYFYRRNVKDSRSIINQDINPDILDIFDVNKQIEEAAIIHNNFKTFQKEIRIIQISNCFNRISEVLTWEIPPKEKIELVKDLKQLVTLEYGDYRKYDFGLLSDKSSILDAEIFDDLDIPFYNDDDNKETIKKRIKMNITKVGA